MSCDICHIIFTGYVDVVLSVRLFFKAHMQVEQKLFHLMFQENLMYLSCCRYNFSYDIPVSYFLIYHPKHEEYVLYTEN